MADDNFAIVCGPVRVKAPVWLDSSGARAEYGDGRRAETQAAVGIQSIGAEWHPLEGNVVIPSRRELRAGQAGGMPVQQGNDSAGAIDGLIFGEAPDGRLIRVSEVPSGLACGLICPHCRERLVAKKGSVIRHHFAHDAESACAGAVETMLHKLAKQIIRDAGGVMLPALIASYAGVFREVSAAGWFTFDSIDLEVWKDGIRPDLIGRRGDRELAIEILVSHACGPDKIAFIEDKQLATIEIDLSAARDRLVDDDFAVMVLHSAPRDWLFNARLRPAMAEMQAAEVARRRKIADDAVAEQAKREAALTAAQREQRERSAKQAEEWRVLDAKRVRERAAATARKLAEFKSDIRAHATLMLGSEAAAVKWLDTRLQTGRSVNLATADDDFDFYWHSLREECARADRLKAAQMVARDTVVAAAAAHFRSKDLAELWLNSRHPKLGMNRPKDECLNSGGVERCLRLLRS